MALSNSQNTISLCQRNKIKNSSRCHMSNVLVLSKFLWEPWCSGSDSWEGIQIKLVFPENDNWEGSKPSPII